MRAKPPTGWDEDEVTGVDEVMFVRVGAKAELDAERERNQQRELRRLRELFDERF